MIFLGKITKTRGNKGEVVIAPSPYFSLYEPGHGEEVSLQSSKYTITKKVDLCRDIRGMSVVKFDTVDTINDAIRLTGYSIFSFKELDNSRLPVFERVITYTVKDISGSVWGEVTNAESFGINQVLEITDSTGDILYVPFTDEIIKNIDDENKVILIDPPDGLKDLNKA